MVRSIAIASTCVLLAACGSPNGDLEASPKTNLDAAGDQQADPQHDAPVWMSEEVTSGLDGRVMRTQRIYAFPERDTHIVVTVSCAEETRLASVIVDSVVGELAAPSERSAFNDQSNASAGAYNILFHGKPVGRVKVNGRPIVDAGDYFRFQGDINNRIHLLASNPLTFDIAHSLPGVPENDIEDPESWLLEQDFNAAHAFKLLLPLSAEFSNGAGAFEITIDRSEEVSRVLAICGSEEGLLKKRRSASVP